MDDQLVTFFFFSSRRRHTRSVSSFPTRRSSDLLDLTEDDFDFLTSNKVWIATDRSRARRCVEACVYGTLDFVGYPRFPAPVEFIAAVIAYYVHPVNIQTACLIRSEERFSRNAETDLVCRLLLEKKKIKIEYLFPIESYHTHDIFEVAV